MSEFLVLFRQVTAFVYFQNSNNPIPFLKLIKILFCFHTYMMFALCTAVTFRLPFDLAKLNAKSATR